MAILLSFFEGSVDVSAPEKGENVKGGAATSGVANRLFTSASSSTPAAGGSGFACHRLRDTSLRRPHGPVCPCCTHAALGRRFMGRIGQLHICCRFGRLSLSLLSLSFLLSSFSTLSRHGFLFPHTGKSLSITRQLAAPLCSFLEPPGAYPLRLLSSPESFGPPRSFVRDLRFSDPP